jgi:hypothetical protein
MSVDVEAIVRPDGIFSLFAPGGDASDWHTRQMRLILRNAIEGAPQGPIRIDPRGGSHAPGNLMRSHRLTGGLRGRGTNGGLGIWGSLYNKAPYAKYVHDGTFGTTITGSRGHLWIPKSSYYYYKGKGAGDNWSGNPLKQVENVRGQNFNPWIARAAAQVLGPHMR